MANPPRPRTSDIRHALLLVGSPKRAKSTSSSLGEYLHERLRGHSIQTQTIFTHSALGSPEGTQAMLDAVDAADLVTLAFPLYVDSLPARVIEALERIAGREPGREVRDQRFTAIVNCGFPEAVHNRTALAICETFARQAGFEWANGLAVGGGEGLIHDKPLAEGGRRTLRFRKSLDVAADALAQGQPIPTAAQDLLAKLIIPSWMYRLIGGRGWKQQAKRYGAWKSIRKQPYAPTPPG